MAVEPPGVGDIVSNLGKLLDQTRRVESGSSRIDTLTGSIARHYSDMAKRNAVVGLGFDRMTAGTGRKSKELAEIQATLTKALLQQNNVMLRREKMMESASRITGEINDKTANPVTNKAEYLNPLKAKLDSLTLSIRELDVETAGLAHQIDFLKMAAEPAALEIGRLTKATAGLAAVSYLSGFTHILSFSNELNKSLVSANSSLQKRQELLQSSLSVQAKTGAASATILEIQREMVGIGADVNASLTASIASSQTMASTQRGWLDIATSIFGVQSSQTAASDALASSQSEVLRTASSIYGVQTAQVDKLNISTRAAGGTRKAYDDILKTAVMLVDGLGMSVQETVQLQITARAAGMEYSKMGDMIAGIVNTTGLAADEAGRYARQLTSAARVAAGSSVKFDNTILKRNIETLSSIEAAMKGDIGIQGEISNLMEQFSSHSKLGGVGMMFGSGGIDFLAKDAEGVSRVLTNLANQTKNMNGPMLEAFASMNNLDPKTLLSLGNAFKRAEEAGMSFYEFYEKRKLHLTEDERLQDRYNKQLASQGAVLSRLGRQLMVLASSALTPVIGFLNLLSLGLMKMSNAITAIDDVVGGFSTALKYGFSFIVTGYLVKKVWEVTTAIAGLVKAMTAWRAAAIAQSRQVPTQLPGALGPKTITPVDTTTRPKLRLRGAAATVSTAASTAASGSSSAIGGIVSSVSTVARNSTSTSTKNAAAINASAASSVSAAAGLQSFLRAALLRLSMTMARISAATNNSVTFGRDMVRGGGAGGAAVASAAGFFPSLFAKAKGFISGIFGKRAATAAGETMMSTASKGIIGRVVSSFSSFFSMAALRGVLGRILPFIGSAVLTAGWSLLVGIVINVVMAAWPYLSGLFSKKKENLQDTTIEKRDEKFAKSFLERLADNDADKMAITLQAYSDILRKQGATEQQVQAYNVGIAKALQNSIAVQSGEAQRMQGIDPKKDRELAAAILAQVKSSERVEKLLEETKKEAAQRDAQAVKREAEARERAAKDMLMFSRGGPLGAGFAR